MVILKNIASAGQLLQTLPIPMDTRGGNPGSWLWIPGLMVGGVVATMGLSAYWLPLLAVGGLMVFAEILITGGLHLDGWADCWDGWGCRHNPDKILEAMKDSRIGSLGAGALIVLLITKISLYSSLPSVMLLLPIHIASRAVIPLCARLLPGRENGLGATFANQITVLHVVINIVIAALGLRLLAGPLGLAALVIALVNGLVFAWYFAKLAQGLGGDILGGAQEIALITLLMVMTGGGA